MSESFNPNSQENCFVQNLPDLENDSVNQLFMNSPIGIYILQDKKFCFVNKEFQGITGYGEKELIGKVSLDIVHPEDQEKVKQRAREMLKGQRHSPYEAKIINKKGEIKHILEVICPVNFKRKRSVLGYFLDNTEQENIKNALRESEEKFHKAFRASPDWVVISTMDEGIYLEVNQAFLHTTGFELDEVIGKSSKELGIWVDPAERDELHEILKNSGRVCNVETRFRVKSGDILYVLWSAEVIEYGGQKCLIAVTRDITDRKLAAEEQLKREKLQGVLEMAGATCHEINQPLQNIVFMLDELISENKDVDLCQILKMQVERIKGITKKLENITTYETKDYIHGSKIIDIDKASFSCPINDNINSKTK